MVFIAATYRGGALLHDISDNILILKLFIEIIKALIII